MIDIPIALTPTARLHVHIECYRGLVVHFSMEQLELVEGVWVKVARVDTSDGSVHRHQFFADGRPEERFMITQIPPSPAGQRVVHDEYETQYDECIDHADERLRRWRQ